MKKILNIISIFVLALAFLGAGAAYAKPQYDIKVYGTSSCPACLKAKILLNGSGFEYKYINIESNRTEREFFFKQGHRYIPQIYINGEHIGGLAELREWLKEHE